jgi:hypothetical protein
LSCTTIMINFFYAHLYAVHESDENSAIHLCQVKFSTYFPSENLSFFNISLT